MFAGFDKDGRDATFGCKVPEEDFTALTSIEGIVPAPYAARFSWVSVDDPEVLPEAEAIALLRGSYDLVRAKLPARFRAEAPTPAPTKRAAKPTKRAAGPAKRAAGPAKRRARAR